MPAEWGGNLTRNLATFNPIMRSRIAASMTFHAPRIEAYARSNATWTDRTGNARRGLTAIAASTGTSFQIVLFHRVPYGIWLEVRWSGKYAIIMRSLNHGAAELAVSFREAFATAARG